MDLEYDIGSCAPILFFKNMYLFAPIMAEDEHHGATVTELSPEDELADDKAVPSAVAAAASGAPSQSDVDINSFLMTDL